MFNMLARYLFTIDYFPKAKVDPHRELYAKPNKHLRLLFYVILRRFLVFRGHAHLSNPRAISYG